MTYPQPRVLTAEHLLTLVWQGVCRLHGICIDSLPNLFLITEPVCGGTLEAYLQTTQSKGVPLERGVPLARSIANAMKDVHAKGVVHRDLKPSNCVLTEYDNKTIKLVDFGLARLIQGDCIPAGQVLPHHDVLAFMISFHVLLLCLEIGLL
jgi:serine/threonine protein kinase